MVNRLADFRTILWVLIYISLMVIQWMHWANHWAIYGLTLYFAFACKVIVHNHLHIPTMKPGWNGIFSWLLAVSTMTTLQFAYAVHVENHHRDHMTEEDRFGVLGYSGRWGLWEVMLCPLWFISNFVRSGKAKAIIQKWNRSRRWRQTELKLHSISIYCLAIGLLIINPANTLLYFVVPNLITIWMIIQTNHFQHIGCSGESDYTHARTIINPISNWLLFNSGFHLAHHLNPRLHWQDLRRYHFSEVAQHVPPQIVHNSILGCIYTLYLKTLFVRHGVYLKNPFDLS